jgi:DNA-binding response OmpR family regulator
MLPYPRENCAVLSSILVLEDDTQLRSLLVEFLGQQKFDVHEARSGSEAIAMGTRRRFDLMLTDVRMEGMDGLETLAALRQAQPGLKSIVMTGYASTDAPVRALALEADDYLYKPFKVKDLLISIKRVLDQGREREGYLSLLNPLVRGLLGRRAEQTRKWEELRDLSFQSFFVGVRSRKLTRDEALSIWDEFERLMRRHGQMDEKETAQSYQLLIDRIAALSRSGISVPRRAGEGVDPERFSRFYQRLRNGEVSPEQLRVAPQVRSMAPEQLEASPKLKELYQKLWG